MIKLVYCHWYQISDWLPLTSPVCPYLAMTDHSRTVKNRFVFLDKLSVATHIYVAPVSHFVPSDEQN